MTAIPVPGVVVIMVIIMCFVAAGQCQGSDGYEEDFTENVLYIVFHDGDLPL
jgi:hypothetical protein